MAERRMFAKSVIGSARFLRMPPTSRLLYYDLGMMADDDGIVEAFTVMRTTGATEDDLRILVAREFITILNDDLVAYISDWKRNNQIRPDRYKPSIYQPLLIKISDGIPDNNQMTTDGIPMVVERETQVRLGKDSIIPPISPKGESASNDLFDRFWAVYPRKVAKQAALKAWKKLNPDETLVQRIIDAVERFRVSTQWAKDNGQFIPHPATFLNGRRWEDESSDEAPAEESRAFHDRADLEHLYDT